MEGVDAMSLGGTEETGDDDEAPKINMEELLDDFDDLNVEA